MLKITAEQKASVAFFGVASSDIDKNMLSMTEDLYYKQLTDIQIELKDRRSESFSDEYTRLSDDIFAECTEDYAFFVLIKKMPSTKWECSINIRNIETHRTNSIKKEYDSYYKIIMDSKTNLKNSIESLFSEKTPHEEPATRTVPATTFTTETIAGTWSGEDMIAKIVIMRGGRGFIVLKNGATMNISVSINSENANQPLINIKQTSSNNASFFTELNRKLALESAVNADPIEWNLEIQPDGSLKGYKLTLIEKNETAKTASIPVEWKKN